MSVHTAIRTRVERRREVLIAHCQMLEEAIERGEHRETVVAQLELVSLEFEFLVELMRTLMLFDILESTGV